MLNAYVPTPPRSEKLPRNTLPRGTDRRAHDRTVHCGLAEVDTLLLAAVDQDPVVSLGLAHARGRRDHLRSRVARPARYPHGTHPQEGTHPAAPARPGLDRPVAVLPRRHGRTGRYLRRLAQGRPGRLGART